MNWRAIGCLGIGILAFVAIGVVGLGMATSQVGCPSRLVWQDQSWDPDGGATSSPRIGSGEEAPIEIGTILVGMTSRTAYGPPGSAPVAGGGSDLPAELSVDCADGTFQGYRAAASRGTPPSPGG